MKNDNRNGFTLVELLAVIVILAIIMIIAIPNVISTMNMAKKKSMIEFAHKVLKRIEEVMMENQLMGYSYPLPAEKNYIIFDIKKDLGLSSSGDYRGFVACVVNYNNTESWYELTIYDGESILKYDEYAGIVDPSKKEITVNNISNNLEQFEMMKSAGLDESQIDVIELSTYDLLHTQCNDMSLAVVKGATREQFSTTNPSHLPIGTFCTDQEKEEETQRLYAEYIGKLLHS